MATFTRIRVRKKNRFARAKKKSESDPTVAYVIKWYKIRKIICMMKEVKFLRMCMHDLYICDKYTFTSNVKMLNDKI